MSVFSSTGRGVVRTGAACVWTVRAHWRLTLLVLLAAAAVAFASVAWAGARHERGLINDQRNALAAAQTRVPLLLSYNYATLKKDLARSQEQATGQFQSDYRLLLNEVVGSTAAARHISTKATVTGAGVISQQGEDVTVLAFLTQRTTAPGATASVTTTEVDVTMRHVGETWKVARLSPH